MRAKWIADGGIAAKDVIRCLDAMDEMERKFAREMPTNPGRPTPSPFAAVKPELDKAAHEASKGR
jgi:hypothetical protein